MERGYLKEQSTVTAICTLGIGHAPSLTAVSHWEFLEETVESLSTKDNIGFYVTGPARDYECIVVVSPRLAEIIASGGLSKRDVQDYLYQKARKRLGDLRGKAYWANRTLPLWVNEEDPDTLLPMVPRPENIVIFVAGGPAGNSALHLGSWSTTHSVTVLIRE